MFQLRHALTLGLAFTCLSSCSVYSESLLAPIEADVEGMAHAGSLSVGAPDDDERGGSSSSSANTGGKAGAALAGAGGSGPGTGAGAGGSDASAGTGASASVGGSGEVGGGGAVGSGGTPPQPSGADVLDDMEDGNFYLVPKAPRYGFWYVAGDATVGAKLPEIAELVGVLSPAREDSTQAVHFTASGFKGWGSSVGLSFTDQASKRVKYDAGNATGISFWVRGTVAGGAKLRVLFPLPGTDPVYELCGTQAQGQCLDHYATQVTVSEDWQQVSIPFSSLHQAGWGAPVTAFDPTEMLGIEWSAGISNLDVWLDDLALTRP